MILQHVSKASFNFDNLICIVPFHTSLAGYALPGFRLFVMSCWCYFANILFKNENNICSSNVFRQFKKSVASNYCQGTNQLEFTVIWRISS